MKVVTLAAAQMGLLNMLPATAEYVWPSIHDHMEDLLVLQGGYIRQGFVDSTDYPLHDVLMTRNLYVLDVAPCTRAPSPERQTAAEWIRTAFHDMATYDKATGTGGLDASIQFETDRSENAGDAFNGTLMSNNNYFTSRSSSADLVALALVVAIGSCGGPKIPLRVGRVDAAEGGVLGVPEPQQDLETHKQKFAKAGFNTGRLF